MIRPWKKLGSKPLGDFRIFTLRADRAISPRTGREHEFFVIDCVSWVNVIALTPDNHLVMVEQYRHGTNRSEEHTSELQSPDHLVCRLLLEKKKKKNNTTTITTSTLK